MHKDFVIENVRKKLEQKGFSIIAARKGAEAAGQEYARATTHSTGMVFAACMKVAEKEAKRIKKSEG